MNTLNNTIGIPDNKMSGRPLVEIMVDAKDKGFTMVMINAFIYSVQAFMDCKQDDEYFLEFYKLFAYGDLIKQVPTPPAVKFDQSFEALYKITMHMADTCIGSKELHQRVAKLHEEVNELFDAFRDYGTVMQISLVEVERSKANNAVKDEMADVLFVLLHIAHKLNVTPFELLHKAGSKMLARVGDPTYKAKC